MPPVAAAIIMGAATIYATKQMADASDRAGKVTEKGTADTIEYTKQKDAQDRETANATAHANYDQWAAREGRLSTLGEMVGVGGRNIPAFAPMPGTGGTNTPGGTTAAPSGNAAGAQAYFDSLFPNATLTPDMLSSQEGALNAKGIKVLRNASGRAGKIVLPDGTGVDVIEGAGSGLNRKQWLVLGSGGAAPATRQKLAPYTADPASVAQPIDPGLSPALLPPPAAPWRPAGRSLNGYIGSYGR